MEAKEFKEFGKEMIDYVANYLENIRERYVNKTLIYMLCMLSEIAGKKLNYSSMSFINMDSVKNEIVDQGHLIKRNNSRYPNY